MAEYQHFCAGYLSACVLRQHNGIQENWTLVCVTRKDHTSTGNRVLTISTVHACPSLEKVTQSLCPTHFQYTSISWYSKDIPKLQTVKFLSYKTCRRNMRNTWRSISLQYRPIFYIILASSKLSHGYFTVNQSV